MQDCGERGGAKGGDEGRIPRILGRHQTADSSRRERMFPLIREQCMRNVKMKNIYVCIYIYLHTKNYKK